MLMHKVSNRLSAKIQFFSSPDSLPALSGDLSRICQCRVKLCTILAPIPGVLQKQRKAQELFQMFLHSGQLQPMFGV